MFVCWHVCLLCICFDVSLSLCMCECMCVRVCVHIYAICIMTGIQLMPKLIKICACLSLSLPNLESCSPKASQRVSISILTECEWDSIRNKSTQLYSSPYYSHNELVFNAIAKLLRLSIIGEQNCKLSSNLFAWLISGKEWN